MLRLVKDSLRRRLWPDRRGNVLIETAMVAGMLGLLAIGAIDFGMAYVRQSEVENAVRAGTQFALARHPSMGEIADGVVTPQEVRDQIANTANFLDSDPGDPPLSVEFSCECPDGTAVQCTSTAISSLPCSDRRTYLTVTLQHDYEMIFAYPGLGQSLNLNTQSSVRLN